MVSLRGAVVLAVVSLLAGLAIRGLLSQPVKPAMPETLSSGSAARSGVEPWSTGREIAGRFEHSEQGAISAAAAYARMGGVLLELAPTEVAAVVRRYASAATAERQIVDVSGRLDAIRDTLAHGRGRIRYLQAVLATRVDAYSEGRCRVVVWSVGVLWRTGAANPQAGWVTSAYDLVWEHDTWKVWSLSTTSGPSPAPNADAPPADAGEFDRLLAGFQAWGAPR